MTRDHSRHPHGAPTARGIIGVARWIDRLTRCPGPYRWCISASRRSTGTSSPSGLVVMSQQVSSAEGRRGRLELRPRTPANPRSPASAITYRARPSGTACWPRRGCLGFVRVVQASGGCTEVKFRGLAGAPACWLPGPACAHAAVAGALTPAGDIGCGSREHGRDGWHRASRGSLAAVPW
jgi:hypothetical protein